MSMRLRERFTFKLSSRDRQVLECLVSHEDDSASAYVRRLIRREARRHGLLRSPGCQDSTTESEAVPNE
jgi:hypothetical protein